MVNFMEISTKSDEIVNLSLKDVYDILSDDLLNCRDEEHVFNVVVRWIDHDPLSRKPAMGKLLRAVRLGLLNTRVCMLLLLFTKVSHISSSRFLWST